MKVDSWKTCAFFWEGILVDMLILGGVTFCLQVLSMELESDDGTIAVGGAPHGFALHLSFLWAFFWGGFQV